MKMLKRWVDHTSFKDIFGSRTGMQLCVHICKENLKNKYCCTTEISAVIFISIKLSYHSFSQSFS